MDYTGSCYDNSVFYSTKPETMSDTLLYFPSLFLNTSANILYFFNLLMTCYITILFLECS